jgi:molybdopterin-guanine dinucleotide biosynthesis protein A
MHCLIIAGGQVRPEDALYPYTQGRPKALIDMGGRTMLERVVAALQGSRQIEDVLVVGLDPATEGLTFARPVEFLPDQGSMVGNMLAGCAWFLANRPNATAILGCTADIPAITPAMVDGFVDACRPWDHGVYYNFVSREKLESRFPNSNRTYSKISGTEVASGGLTVVQPAIAERNRALLEMLTAARKHPWRVARIVGLPFLLKFLFQRVTFADVEATAGRIIGAPVQIVLSSPAEVAMDADKPFQVDMLRAEFAA